MTGNFKDSMKGLSVFSLFVTMIFMHAVQAEKMTWQQYYELFSKGTITTESGTVWSYKVAPGFENINQSAKENWAKAMADIYHYAELEMYERCWVDVKDNAQSIKRYVVDCFFIISNQASIATKWILHKISKLK